MQVTESISGPVVPLAMFSLSFSFFNKTKVINGTPGTSNVFCKWEGESISSLFEFEQLKQVVNSQQQT